MTEFTLHRYEDVSTVSGTGDVAWGVEWPDGAVALRWPGEHPSTAVWPDIRDVEAIHGHGGKTVVQYDDAPRLLRAYQRVVPLLLEGHRHPFLVGPHPDHMDRLRLVFSNGIAWSFWVALLDGSTFAASHSEVNGEMRHCWISPDGDIWLEHFTPLPNDNEGPLAIFDEEDR